MDAIIKVHAGRNGSYIAECQGRAAIDSSPEPSPLGAAKRVALRVLGLRVSLLHDDELDNAIGKTGITVTHVRSDLDEETFQLSAPDP